MPDDRLIHLALGQSEKINTLSDFQRGVWLIYKLAADDFGVMRYSAAPLQGAARWLEVKPPRIVLQALKAILNVGLIGAFDHQAQPYVFQHDWQTWQKITHPRQTKQPAPPLDRCDANTRWLLSHHPKGGRLKSWQAPELEPEKSGSKPGEKREQTGIAPEVKPVHSRPVVVDVGNGGSSGCGCGDERPARTTETEALRAGAFVERYASLHQTFRNGAKYVGKMHLDFQEALTLVKAYPDERLDLLARVWFQADDDFAESGTRTMAKFRSRVSWCEEQLIAFEQKQAAGR